MRVVKKGVIPKNAPLVKKCTRVISVILGHINHNTSRNLEEVPM